MMGRWPTVRLGDVVAHRKQFINIDDTATYRRPRVQLHAQGIVLRDELPGALIKTKAQQICRAGELLVAEIDAKVGGFGIVPEALDGSIVSSHYFLFDVDKSKLDPPFLDYFIRTPAFRDQVEAQGSTNYAAIRPAHVLAYETPLPPLGEQRRIVARIEELSGEIQEARRLQKDASVETQALMASASRSLFGGTPASDWVALRTFVTEFENGRSPQCEPRPATPDEWGVLKVGSVSFGAFDQSQNKALPATVRMDPRYEVKPGDFLMSRANTTELVGACAIVHDTRPKLLLSDKTFRLHFRAETGVEPEWMDYVLKSPGLREQISRGASGTSPTMKNISKEKVFGLLVPPHSPDKQREVVADLNALRMQTTSLHELQEQSAVELNALMPAILDRAFRGEL